MEAKTEIFQHTSQRHLRKGRIPVLSILGIAVFILCAYLVANDLMHRLSENPAESSEGIASRIFAKILPNRSLSKDILNALIEVKGDSGQGSGFLTEWHGKTFIVTNIHVIHNNQNLMFYTSTGEALQTGEMFVARDYDVAIISVENPPATLSIMEQVESKNIVGERVIVPGNSLGGGVFASLTGKVLALGPQLIEVDAKFVSGNSGSPIVISHAFNTPKVIGIATYTKTIGLEGRDKLSKFQNTRWFGYRLDNITDWNKVVPADFTHEGRIIYEIEQRTDDIITLLTEGTGRILRDPDFKALIKNRRSRGIVESRSAKTREDAFLIHLRILILKDIERHESTLQYGYYQKRLKEQKEIRMKMMEAIEVASIPQFTDF